MDHLDAMRVFVRVANTRSFAKAAVQLDQSPGTVTRQIKSLESHLGTRLLHRTTRAFSLTDAGHLYLERITRILDALDDATQAVADYSAEPAGVLRILAPVVFSQRNLVPMLQSYQNKYPNVLPELFLTDSDFDLIDRGYDVGIVPTERVRGVTAVTRTLLGSSTAVCAAPSYLKAHGSPVHPHELANHATLTSSRSRTNTCELRFTGPEGEFSVTVRPSFAANDTEVLRQAAVNGMGISFLPSAMVVDDIRDGHLVSLLDDYRLPGRVLHIVYASRHHLPLKTRTFIDHLISWFSDEANTRSDIGAQ